MASLNDPVIDELQNEEGNVFIGRAPAQGWLKPERVTLRTPRNTLLVGLLGPLPEDVKRPELEFVLHKPRRALQDRRTCRVKPTGQILEKFLSLASASDKDIHDFASKFGPLLIFCREVHVRRLDVE